MTPIHPTLSQAIDRYLAGTATAEEQEAVRNWYHSFSDEEIDIPASIVDLRTRVGQKIWTRLQETMHRQEEQESPVKAVAWYRNRWLRVAAVAIGLLAGGYWLLGKWNMPEQTAQQNMPVQPLENDVAPGSNKAILTLADGFRIVLDSVENGALATQGQASVVKLADGQVVYNTRNPLTTDGSPLTYNTITTPKGGQFQLMLSDGSKVWLNAASSIRYPTTFAAHERVVEITGEAYFEVSPLPTTPGGRGVKGKIPFIVSVNGKTRVEVLGTHFNISAYDDEDAIKTTLLEGKVKVVSGESSVNERSVILQPGEQAAITTNHQLQTTNKVDLDEVVAWKNGLFQFNHTDIKVLMRQIARWYNIEVHYEGTPPAMQITGKAPRNISLATMLKILELSDVKYRIEGGVLTVKN
jgi:transmembrane sensor